MVEQGKCPQCGKAMPSDTPQGLCPACLLRRGLETNTIGDTGGASGARWTPPAVEELAPLFPELDIIELIGRGGMGAAIPWQRPSPSVSLARPRRWPS